jgi:hypothetical protein
LIYGLLFLGEIIWVEVNLRAEEVAANTTEKCSLCYCPNKLLIICNITFKFVIL